MIGLTLAEGKRLLGALQVHLVRAQTADHCHRRRRCQRCGMPPLGTKRKSQLSPMPSPLSGGCFGRQQIFRCRGQ
jgi:hypothetical protein